MKWMLVLFLGVMVSQVSALEAVQGDDCPCGGHGATSTIDELLGCYSDTRCEMDNNEVSIALRLKGRYLADTVQYQMHLSNSPLLTEKERSALMAEIRQERLRLRAIKKLLGIKGYESVLEPLYVDFDAEAKNYFRHYYTINVGYEYVSLEEIFQKGFPRLGLIAYRRYGETPSMQDGLHYYGFHLRSGIQLTSSAESATSITSLTQPIATTLEASLEGYVPLFRSLIQLNGYLSDYMGPLISIGAKKNDNDARVSKRIYGGVRSAINPETYVDVLMGRSDGLNNMRLEIRGQLPIFKFDNGSRVFLGGILNMNIPGLDNANAERDVVRFYADWNADVAAIVNSVAPGLVD